MPGPRNWQVEALAQPRLGTQTGRGIEGQFTDTKRSAFTGQDIRFTTKGNSLYAIALAWPGNAVSIQALGSNVGLWSGQITDVQLLGYPGKLTWQRHDDRLTIQLPDQPPGQYAFVFKVRG